MIVTNADGQDPGIYFFDHDWNQKKYYPMSPLAEAPYNIEVSEESDGTLQVFVAGTNSISIVEHVKSKANDSYFNMIPNVFVSSEAQPFPSDRTYAAKSADYLIIKQSSQRTL